MAAAAGRSQVEERQCGGEMKGKEGREGEEGKLVVVMYSMWCWWWWLRRSWCCNSLRLRGHPRQGCGGGGGVVLSYVLSYYYYFFVLIKRERVVVVQFNVFIVSEKVVSYVQLGTHYSASGVVLLVLHGGGVVVLQGHYLLSRRSVSVS